MEEYWRISSEQSTIISHQKVRRGRSFVLVYLHVDSPIINFSIHRF